MAPRTKRDLSDANISFDLERLFDPYNFDHIPWGKRLDLFKQRDLPHVRHYKAAVKIFGGPARRTRAIIAPPMETPLKHRLGIYHNVFVPPSAPALNNTMEPPEEHVKEPSKEEKVQQAEDEKISNYKSWIATRKQLRGDLENLGLNEAFLDRKPNKTELEQRVKAKFKADRLWKPEPPTPPEKIPTPKPLPNVPSMEVPPPDGLQILDKFLCLNRMRLMDLFLIADKDKSWGISRQELLDAVSKAEIPLTEAEVDDIMITLDQDNDDELSYKEINKGLTQWRKERRNIKKIEAQQNSRGGQIQSSEKTSKPDSRERIKANVSSPRTRTHSKETTIGDEKGKSSKSSLREKVSRESELKSVKRLPSREGTSSPGEKQLSTDLVPSREHSDVAASKTSFSREDRAHTEDNHSSHNLTNPDVSLPASVQRARTSDMHSSNIPMSREAGTVDKPKTASESLPLDSQLARSIYEDALFPLDDTPRVTISAQDIGEDEEKDDSDKSKEPGTETESQYTKSMKGKRPGSKSSSGSRSQVSTPNSLEPPDPDLRDEARAPDSPEAMVDIRKHDRVVLSRNNIRRSLSREKRLAFDELPGVIKVGYKPIDDHCSESTIGGKVAEAVNQYRRDKLKEYFEVKKMFEERGVPFTIKTLDKVLLHPGDKPVNSIKKDVTFPLGPLTDEQSPFNQAKPKKKSKKKRRGVSRLSRASLNDLGALGGSTGGSDNAKTTRGGGVSFPSNKDKTPGASRGFSGSSGGGIARRNVDVDDDERSGSGGSKRSYITVEDIYPFASTVMPKIYKENLSSGRALITRKVDNWMTFEEYSKYTQNLPNRFRNLNRKSNPDAAWPGYLLDKLRILTDEDLAVVDGRGRPLENRDSVAYEGLGTGLYNGRGNAVFRATAQPKRAYPGYNNDLLTWPLGENGVRYGNIDQHRLVS